MKETIINDFTNIKVDDVLPLTMEELYDKNTIKNIVSAKCNKST